jgi:hypothetical protein
MMLATNTLTGSLTWLCPELRSGCHRLRCCSTKNGSGLLVRSFNFDNLYELLSLLLAFVRPESRLSS